MTNQKGRTSEIKTLLGQGAPVIFEVLSLEIES